MPPAVHFAALLVSVATVLSSTPARSVVIDDFAVPQTATPETRRSTVEADVPGGVRDLFISGPSEISDGLFKVRAGGSDSYTLYNGEGIDYQGFDPTQMSVDLTEGGTHNAVAIDVLAATDRFKAELWVWDSTRAFGIADVGWIAPPEAGETLRIIYDFESYFSLMDPSSTAQILFAVTPVSGEVIIDSIYTTYVIPEPSSGLLACVGLGWLGRRRRTTRDRERPD